ALVTRPLSLPAHPSVAFEPAETMLYCRLLAGLELARVHLDEGDHEAAVQTFDRAEAHIEAERFGPDGRGWLTRTGLLVALVAGDLDTARSWVERDRDPFWHGVGRARIL